MPISENFKSIHSKNFEVNFSQIMPNGFLKISELLNFLQLTAAEHSELGGISFVDMQVHHQAWVLSKMRLEINNLPKWNDIVTVETWIVSLENSRSLRALKISVGDRIVATCETFWVVLNTLRRRPEALALPHLHFKKFDSFFANKKRIESYKPSESQELAVTRKVVFSDLDLVNHMNHIKYLEWCLDCLPAEMLIQNRLKVIEMYFMSELVLDDLVSINKTKSEKVYQFSIEKNGKISFGTTIECC